MEKDAQQMQREGSLNETQGCNDKQTTTCVDVGCDGELVGNRHLTEVDGVGKLNRLAGVAVKDQGWRTSLTHRWSECVANSPRHLIEVDAQAVVGCDDYALVVCDVNHVKLF